MAHSFVSVSLARVGRALLIAMLSAVASTSYAAVHLWQITEVFSSADGSVQFIEMFDSSSGETQLGGTQLLFNADGVETSYTFLDHLPPGTATAGKSLLIATSGFSAIAGVTPDYVRAPGQFFDPNLTNLTVTFTGSFSELQASDGDFPTDGLNSWTQSGSATNSPKNIHGQTGFVNLSQPPGDFNADSKVNAADFVLWRKNSSSFLPATYTTWRANFANPAGSGSGLDGTATIPEPATAVLSLVACTLLPWLVRRQR